MKPETRSFYRSAVQRGVERVLASLDEALDLEQLARLAALSPFHFHRIFRGIGETPRARRAPESQAYDAFYLPLA